MKIFLAILAIIITYVFGYGVYLWSKLSPILNDPRASVQLVPYQLKPYDGPTRQINLGYAKFHLPAMITDDPVQYDDTLVVVFGENRSKDKITFMPPLVDGEDSISMLESFHELTGERLANSFEFQKRAIATQPFTFWKFISRNMKRNGAEATLLLAKIPFVHPADASVSLYETDLLGFFINIGSETTSVTIYDKQNRCRQGILFNTGRIPINALIPVLANSYQITSTATTEEEFLRQLRTTGIRSASSRATPPAPAEVDRLNDTDKTRLKEIADEIRRRRTEKVNSGQK